MPYRDATGLGKRKKDTDEWKIELVGIFLGFPELGQRKSKKCSNFPRICSLVTLFSKATGMMMTSGATLAAGNSSYSPLFSIIYSLLIILISPGKFDFFRDERPKNFLARGDLDYTKSESTDSSQDK